MIRRQEHVYLALLEHTRVKQDSYNAPFVRQSLEDRESPLDPELDLPRIVKVGRDLFRKSIGRNLQRNIYLTDVYLILERCPAGKYYDEDAGLCRSCGHGFFQPNEGSFQCFLCGLGKTTRTTEAVSAEVSCYTFK
jgi:ribosomal protein L37E